MKTMKRYSDVIQIDSFDERFKYLAIGGRIGIESFGYDRYLNQVFYNSEAWKKVRREVILRDNGCDLGHPDHPIAGKVIIHHLNPITVDDVLDGNEDIFNTEYLICVSHATHNALHFGNLGYLDQFKVFERRPNDTSPWRQVNE